MYSLVGVLTNTRIFWSVNYKKASVRARGTDKGRNKHSQGWAVRVSARRGTTPSAAGLPSRGHTPHWKPPAATQETLTDATAGLCWRS